MLTASYYICIISASVSSCQPNQLLPPQRVEDIHPIKLGINHLLSHLSTISSHPSIPSSLLFSSRESRLCSFPHQQHQTPTHPCAHTPTASTAPTATNTRALSTAPPANSSNEPPVAAVSHPYFPSSRIVLGGVAFTQTTQPTGETAPRLAARWFWEIPTNHTHHGRGRMDGPRLNESNGFISASKPTLTRCSFLDRVNGRVEASFLDRESATPWWTHEEPFHFNSLS